MVEIVVRSVKKSQEFFTVEYTLADLPVSGQVSIPISEWSDDRVTAELTKDVKAMTKEIEMLKKLMDNWDGKKITLDI